MTPPPELLSVVIPAYRESARIRSSVREVLAYFDSLSIPCEVIVVDDGSDDDTPSIVSALASADPRVKSLRLPSHSGKGAAVRAGILSSRGDFLLLVDADLSIPLQEYPAFAAALSRGADFALASKQLGRRAGLVRQPLLRTLMGRIFNLAVRLLVLPGISDSQAGFKLLRGPAARTLAPELLTPGFAYDVELLALARSRRLSLRELPVRCLLSRQTSVRLLPDSLRMLRDLIAIRRRLGRISPREDSINA